MTDKSPSGRGEERKDALDELILNEDQERIWNFAKLLAKWNAKEIKPEEVCYQATKIFKREFTNAWNTQERTRRYGWN